MESLVVIMAIIGSIQPKELSSSPELQQAVAEKWRISELSESLARKHTTEEQRRYVGNVALVTRIIVERKVTYELSF